MKNTTKYHGLVNRKRIIATLEDKAEITGFRWLRPQKIQKGFFENRSEKGDFLYYSLVEPFDILDVDGRKKVTIKTSYYKQDRETPHKQDTVGVWTNGLASTYHGRKSSNWVLEYLTLNEIIDVLNAGYAFAPGFFSPPPGQSVRTAKYCEYRLIRLFDGDEWTDEHPAPANLSELIKRYPDLSKDFYWIGESISSRSSLKPELRIRLMQVLPIPIYKGQSELWEVSIDATVAKYPFIARGVGIDKVRLSFGNARPECENLILGGIVSLDTFSEWEHIASEKQKQTAALKAKTESINARRKERRDKNETLKKELARRGHAVVENVDPLVAFCEIDPESLLVELGLAFHLSGNAWNWHDSSPGRSFELSDGVIKPFSNTMQSASPETDGTKPVNAHRYILYYLHKLDMTQDRDKRELRCILADQGYGTHPDVYRQSKREVKIAGVREGLISPLELRAPADSLPKERPGRVLQTLRDNSKAIAKAFQQKARVVGLRAGTGEGKTEEAVSFAVNGGSVAMNLNTIPLAEQVYSRFDKAETHAFLWRSRWYGYGSSESDRKRVHLIPIRERIRSFERGDVLCIKPHLCKNAQDKGIPAPVAVCSSCEVQSECRSDGYLSQRPLAQKTQVLCIAQPKLFLDPLHRGFFRELSKGQPSDRVCVIDEAKAHDLFIDCSLPKAVLQQWVRDWAGEALGDFAEKVLDMLEVKTLSPYAIAELVNGFSDKELRTLSKQASRYRVKYERIGRGATDQDTGQVLARHSVQFAGDIEAYVALDFDAYKALQDKRLPAIPPQEVLDSGFMTLTPAQAFALGIYKQSDLDGINTLPRLWEQSSWTPFQQLKAFSKRYQREVDAPIWYDKGILKWVIPPIVHSRVKRLVCMSATLQKEGFERAFDSVPTTFIETPPTHWVSGAKAFQVRTGRYPRRTLLNRVFDNEIGKWKMVGFSNSGKRYLASIEREIARDRSIKHVLITFNDIVEFYGKELTEKHKNLDVLSFHKMEGLDYTQEGMVFWVFGLPDVTGDVVDWRAKVLYGNDSEPLNYERDNDSREYVDPRVHLCWLSEVVARLQQAVGRGRLNRQANTVIVFSNVLIPDFTGRAVGFVPEDIEVAGSLDNLETFANQRSEVERDAPKEQKKTTRKKKQEARDLKSEQKKMALALYASGMSVDQIAIRIGRNKSTVFRWVEKAKF